MANETAIGKFLSRVLARVSVRDPSREQLAEPYKRGYPLTANNVLGALGAPAITFPGATGYMGGPSSRQLEKGQIVYKDALPPGYRQIGGGYTFSGFDAPPTGGLFNAGQV